MKIYLVPKSSPSDNIALVICVNKNSISLAKFTKTEEDTKGDARSLVSLLKCKEADVGLYSHKRRTIVSATSIGLPAKSGNWRFENASILDFSKDYGVGERSAHAMWRFNLADNGMVAENSFAETLAQKSSNWVASRRHPRNAVLYLPFSTSKPSDPDATFQVFVHNPNLVSCLTGQKMKTVTLEEIYRLRDTKGEFLPKLLLSEEKVSPSGERLFRIDLKWDYSPTPKGEEVYVSATAGYLNKSKVVLDDKGRGYFKWLPLALDSGEKANIQVGFRLFSGVASVDVEVS